MLLYFSLLNQLKFIGLLVYCGSPYLLRDNVDTYNEINFDHIHKLFKFLIRITTEDFFITCTKIKLFLIL